MAIEDEPVDFDIICQSDCITMEADWAEVASALKINHKNPYELLSLGNYLKSTKIFQNISIIKILDLCTLMKLERFKYGETIFEDKSEGDKIYLIYTGSVKIMKNDKFLRELAEGNCFGEISVLLNQKHSAKVVAFSEELLIYTLEKDIFLKFFDKNTIDYFINKILMEDQFNTSLENLYYVKQIGQGKFGSVSLVHNTKNIYAIKAATLKQVEQQKHLVKYFQNERNILLSTDFQFVVQLIKTLKNDEYIFFLMEYIRGFTLSKYFSERPDVKLKSKKETQFFIGNILLVINYLNTKNIAHRDLKPDNIMIDERGYLKLVDFGTSTFINNYTYTMIGTPHYMSPEVLNLKGYGLSVDYWSIGIIMYECYFGTYPFGNNANDPMEVYQEILKR